MRILFCASEATPYAKSGGLADVIGALPSALARRGHDVRVVLPRYGWIRRDPLTPLPGALRVPMGATSRYGEVLEDRSGPLPVYLLEHNAYYDRPWLYGPPGGAFADNCERFAFLSSGSLAYCHALGFVPDVIHVHDWHTAVVPVLLHAFERRSPLGRVATVLTIHNIGYQGVFPKEDLPRTGLGWEYFTHLELEYNDQVNLLKGGILHATRLTTVSPTHASEIQTPAGGFGLDGVIRERARDLTGILNGIDVDVWDPQRDPRLPANYGPDDLRGKAICKTELQRSLGLPVDPEIPLVGMISRLTEQKGTDQVASLLPQLLGLGVQICLLGSGDPLQEQAFRLASARAPDRLVATIGYSEPLAHRIEAGADFFLMPSRYEPCGLNQLYSQRYGTLPLVRPVGGLADTVSDYDEATGEGTGFVIPSQSPEALLATVTRAKDTFHRRPEHLAAMRRRAMAQDVGWHRAAAAYEQVYEQAIGAPRR